MVNDINNNQKRLWKDYYPTLKPHCTNCLQQGIKTDEYTFCSTEKQEPFPIYEEDAWGRRKQFKGYFKEIYQCNAYHWTIYQGKNLKN